MDPSSDLICIHCVYCLLNGRKDAPKTQKKHRTKQFCNSSGSCVNCPWTLWRPCTGIWVLRLNKDQRMIFEMGFENTEEKKGMCGDNSTINSDRASSLVHLDLFWVYQFVNRDLVCFAKLCWVSSPGRSLKKKSWPPATFMATKFSSNVQPFSAEWRGVCFQTAAGGHGPFGRSATILMGHTWIKAFVRIITVYKMCTMCPCFLLQPRLFLAGTSWSCKAEKCRRAVTFL